MFSSLSACTPNTYQKTSYVATSNHILNISNNITVKVNNVVVSSRPIQISAGSTVEATVVAPAQYLESQFYSYTVDATQQYFAVVNKNNYIPTLKPENQGQRWYNYLAQEHSLSFKAPNQRPTVLPTTQILGHLTESLHVVPDPLTNSIYFYTKYGWPVSQVRLPNAPIACQEIVKTVSENGNIEKFYLALTNTGTLYLINLDRSTLESSIFKVEIYSDWVLENYFDIDIEFQGSFTNIARSKKKNALQPEVTCFGFDGEYIWLTGRTKLWILDLNFNIINEYLIPEFVNGLVLYNNYGYITTKNNEVYRISITGQTELIYESQAIGPPEVHNGYIYVPDCNQARIIKIDPATLEYTFIQLTNVAPAYIKADSTGLYVSCHDNNQVVYVDNNEAIQLLVFDDKVAWVSAIDGYLIASHWLKDFQLLLDGFQKVISFKLSPRRGTLTHIGTAPVKIKTLGDTTVNVITSPGISILVNGLLSVTVSNNDFLGASFLAATPGMYRRPIVIGEDAIDYDIEVIESTTNVRDVGFLISEITSDEVTVLAILPKVSFGTAAIEYGTLYVNGALYSGEAVLEEGNIVTILVPVAGDQKPIAPIFTLENRNFAVPISYSSEATVIEQFDLPNNQILPAQSFLVQQTGTYLIPRYLEYPPAFQKNTTTITTQTVDLVAQDILTISNIRASSRIFDEKSIFVLGPENFQVKTRTAGQDLIDYLLFDVLNEPFAKTETPYTSNELVIHNAGILGAVLVLTDQNSDFIVDGILSGKEVTVFSESSVAISRTVQTYYEGNLIVYQKQTDGNEVDLIPRGRWPINNIPLTAKLYQEFNDHNVTKEVSIIESQYIKQSAEVASYQSNTQALSKADAQEEIRPNAITELITRDKLDNRVVLADKAILPVATKNFEWLSRNYATRQLSIDKLFAPITVAYDTLNFAATMPNLVNLENRLLVKASMLTPDLQIGAQKSVFSEQIWVHVDEAKEVLVTGSNAIVEPVTLQLTKQSILARDENHTQLLSLLETNQIQNQKQTEIFSVLSNDLLHNLTIKFDTNMSALVSDVKYTGFVENLPGLDNYDATAYYRKNQTELVKPITGLFFLKHNSDILDFAISAKFLNNESYIDSLDKTLIIKNNIVKVKEYDENLIHKSNSSEVDNFENDLMNQRNIPRTHVYDANILVITVPWEQQSKFRYLDRTNIPIISERSDDIVNITEPEQAKFAKETRKQLEFLKLYPYNVTIDKILEQHKKAQQIATSKFSTAHDPAFTVSLVVTKEFELTEPTLVNLVTKEFELTEPTLVNLVTKEFELTGPTVVNLVTKEFQASEPHLIIPVDKFQLELAESKMITLTANDAMLDIEYIWTSTQYERYGAYLSETAAYLSVEEAGYENAIVVPILGSSYYTYEILFSLDATCEVPAVVARPIAWLIRGG